VEFIPKLNFFFTVSPARDRRGNKLEPYRYYLTTKPTPGGTNGDLVVGPCGK